MFGEWGLTPGAGGRNGVRDGIRDNKEALIRALEYFFPTFLLMIGNQSMYQKFFSAKSEKDASTAVVGWVFGTVVLETLIVTLAVVGSGLFALSLVPAAGLCAARDYSVHGTPLSAAGGGSAADGSGVREGDFDRE